MDPVIRPKNGLLLIGLQSTEDEVLTLDPTLHAVPVEEDSFTYPSPFGTEAVSEANGSYVASAPMVFGQPAPISFRSRLKGAGPGVTYTSLVKPPLHAPLQMCGMRGQFTAAIVASALTAGAATTGTLGTGYTGTANLYRGLPLILSVGPGAGHVPIITEYTAGKLATLSDTFSPVLSTSTLAAIPANWAYAGTSPADAAARLADHPAANVWWYEDGNLYKWINVRGLVDFEGDTARPGFAVFNASGTYLGSSTAAMPTNAVVASHSAPMLVKGVDTPPAALINRVPLPISRWASRAGSSLETPADPNTSNGFGAAQITGRTPMFEADPLRTLVSTRDALAEIAAAANYPIALRFGNTAGNRLAIVHPLSQPVSADPSMRGKLRADQVGFQALTAGRDSAGRDGDRYVTFF